MSRFRRYQHQRLKSNEFDILQVSFCLPCLVTAQDSHPIWLGWRNFNQFPKWYKLQSQTNSIVVWSDVEI